MEKKSRSEMRAIAWWIIDKNNKSVQWIYLIAVD